LDGKRSKEVLVRIVEVKVLDYHSSLPNQVKFLTASGVACRFETAILLKIPVLALVNFLSSVNNAMMVKEGLGSL
jgi:hypothetical protein